MKISFNFNGKRLAVGGFLMALGGAVGTQISNFLPIALDPWVTKLGLVVLLIGIGVSIAGFLRVAMSAGKVLPKWDTALVYQSIREAPEGCTISMLQTSFPDGASLIPMLKTMLAGGKRVRLRVLMTHPTSDTGKAIISGRVRHRDDAAEFHGSEIEQQISQFIEMKAQVDAKWEKTLDQAKLQLEIRLYDHLPFGPQYHIGEEVSYLGFFISNMSSVHAPMLEIRPRHGEAWKIFRDEYEAVWERSEVKFPV